MRGDVKKKILPPPLRGQVDVVGCVVSVCVCVWGGAGGGRRVGTVVGGGFVGGLAAAW